MIILNKIMPNKITTKPITASDNRWVLGLFGTAVGAGILFLPINAGSAGIYPVFVMILLVPFMTYFSHRGLARFVLQSKKESDNITEVLEDNFGKVSGYIINILYFLAIYPICLAYGVGLTNTINSFIVNQLHYAEPSRMILATVLITLMMLVMVRGQHFMLKATTIVVYPLLFLLFVCALYLIPSWHLSALSLSTIPSISGFFVAIILAIPVLVFAFNHSPAISSFVVDMKHTHKENAETKINSVLLKTSLLLTIFILFFVISCVLSLNPEQLNEARAENLPILSYLANVNPSSVLLIYIAPLIALSAIVSSFFGHYLGAKEGLDGIIVKQLTYLNKKPNMYLINHFSTAFIYISMIVVAVLNPNILGFIEELGGPVIAIILFLMPVYAILKIPALRQYADKRVNSFVIIIGLITFVSLIYKLVF